MHMDLKHRSKPFTASMCDNDNATRPPVVNMRPLPDGGVWLGTTELLQLLREPPSDILHDSVPSGHKENVFCLVNNTANVERHSRGQRRAFDDDCGAWNSAGGRLNSFPYLCTGDGAPRRVFLNGGRYCFECRAGGKRTYMPFDPQPVADTVTTLTRYYGTLNADATFKKRVTWDAASPNIAVVEYQGSQPPPCRHGNAKTKTSTAYVRTPAATMSKVGDMVKDMQPKKVYNECLVDGDPLDAPRNARSVRDKKRYELEKVRHQKQKLPHLNFADEILQVRYIDHDVIAIVRNITQAYTIVLCSITRPCSRPT